MPIKKLIAFLGTTFLALAIYAAPTEAATYEVVQGDSLFKIAQKHGITVAKLKTTNNLKSNTITAGQTLTVPSAKVTTSKSTGNDDKVEEKNYKTIRVTSTAYTASCKGCSGITATGINLKRNPNMKVIAVDPRVIPLGSKVWVEGYGMAIAGDTGGAIKGNKIDVFLPTNAKARNWGRRTVTIKVYQ